MMPATSAAVTGRQLSATLFRALDSTPDPGSPGCLVKLSTRTVVSHRPHRSQASTGLKNRHNALNACMYLCIHRVK